MLTVVFDLPLFHFVVIIYYQQKHVVRVWSVTSVILSMN